LLLVLASPHPPHPPALGSVLGTHRIVRCHLFDHAGGVVSPRAGVDRVRAALDVAGVQTTSHPDGSIRGRCPVHRGETRTSLSLQHYTPRGSDRGRARMRCWAGCDERDVLDLIGLSLGDLYDDPPPPMPGSVVREHVYLDAAANLVGVVRRGEPKTFRPATPTSTGWQAKAGDELPRLPYRLPAVVAAVANGNTIYITEGERDADALATVEITATCNAGGAGKWTDAHAHWLRGAHVAVCRDRDTAGERHAAQVLTTLTGVAASVRLVEPAEGKDVTEHLAAGRTVDDLTDIPIPPNTEHDTPTAAVLVPLATVKPERITWLWKGHLPGGKLCTLDGDPSVSKSTLGVELAARISTGTPWPDGAPCDRGDVLILSAEDGLSDTIRPRLDAAGGDPERVHALTAVRAVTDDGAPCERPPTLADIGPITAAIEQTAARLVIVDVLMAYLPGRVDSHKDQDVRAVLSRLSTMCEDTGAAMILLRHLNKSTAGSPLYRGGGSIGIVGAARAGWLVARDPDDEHTRVLACTKSNLAPEFPSLAYRLESAPGTDVARIVWTGESTHHAGDLLRTERDDSDARRVDTWLLDLLNQHHGKATANTVNTAADAAGFSTDQIKRAKKRCRIESVKAGMDGGWVWVAPTEEGMKGAKGAPLTDPPPSPPSVPPSEPVCDRCLHPSPEALILGRCRVCAYPTERHDPTPPATSERTT